MGVELRADHFPCVRLCQSPSVGCKFRRKRPRISSFHSFRFEFESSQVDATSGRRPDRPIRWLVAGHAVRSSVKRLLGLSLIKSILLACQCCVGGCEKASANAGGRIVSSVSGRRENFAAFSFRRRAAQTIGLLRVQHFAAVCLCCGWWALCFALACQLRRCCCSPLVVKMHKVGT